MTAVDSYFNFGNKLDLQADTFWKLWSSAEGGECTLHQSHSRGELGCSSQFRTSGQQFQPTVTTGATNYLWTTPRESKKKTIIVLIFSLLFCVIGSSLCLLGSRNQLQSPLRFDVLFVRSIVAHNVLKWRCNETYIYADRNTSTCIQARKFKLRMKVEDGRSCCLAAPLAPPCRQFSH
jgi:hypothetical protein